MRTETKQRGRLGMANLAWGVALAVSWVMVGCGDEGPARQPVSGVITLDGKPLPSGSVTFAPLDGATAATAEIRDGAYCIGRSEGPAPGRYQVEINAVQPTGKRIKHPDLPSSTIDEVRNVIPVNYNVRTQLAIVVTSDGENAFPFDLTTPRRVASRTRGR
ncbi:hypothetical protein SAMN05444166_4649 [Singulisphaera sp. GP187]|uniref:hypothetical protein n=1 Tax=Singulisphaera sp. GP187 TaxID=1882752 RepID=UPI00092A9B9B|nr:hypothetical protein [Singulisphaera sp. GP187]SIO42973.1 hypothetical protein SAMN05444166_4649 [Singulisphaera sp. GP187]